MANEKQKILENFFRYPLGRLVRYRNNLDVYRIDGINFESEGKCAIIGLNAYNLVLEDRNEIPFRDIEKLEFVDENSEKLALVLKEGFR